MTTKTFTNAIELGEFLRQHFEGPFFSYGITHELVQTEEGVKPLPAIKPHYFFRGQTKAYNWLLPGLFRDFAPLNRFSLEAQLTLRAKDGSQGYSMPNPYYREDLSAEMYFSAMKRREIETLLAGEFAKFEGPIDAGALCQHYGLRTPLIDFTESVDVALFFATQQYPGRPELPWIPCDQGIGVIYMLEREAVHDGCVFYEIGIQPLPRPFAQRGSALLIEPDVNLLTWPELHPFCFNHNRQISEHVGRQLEHGRLLFPEDPYATLIASKAMEKHISRAAYKAYFEEFPEKNRDRIMERVQHLFATRYSVRE